MKLTSSLKKFAGLFLITLLIVSCSDSNSPGTAPKISAVSPNQASIGYMVEITGSDFGVSQSTSTITFSGVNASSFDVSYWSDTKIKCFVPESSVTGKLFVTVNGKKSNEVDFTVVQRDSTGPWIKNLDQKIAQATQKIGIWGTNFGSSQGSSYVEFNGTRASTYTNWTDTKITVVVPEGAITGKVVVNVNGKWSNGVDFTVQSSNQIVPMVTIPAGEFNMGSLSGDDPDNRPVHKVKLLNPFLMAKTEISQKQWKVVMSNSNPSHPNDVGDDKPVQQVTFTRAIQFCNELSKMEQRTPCYTINGESVTCNWDANGYRLPTEAEWEYAARAGQTDEFLATDILNMAWCSDNAAGHTKPCGTKPANLFGLYDMLGNVYEMCWDFYDAEYYKTGDKIDPWGPNEITPERVMRGGSFQNSPELCGATIRKSYPSTNDNYNFNLGFRVVRKAK